MKRLHLILALFLLILLPLPERASAENTKNVLKMEELTIQVMPEYSYHPKDKKKNTPPLLVGFHGALKNESNEAEKGQVVIPLPFHEKNFRIGFVADYSRDLAEMNEIKYDLDKEKGTISWETSYEIQPQEIYKFVIEYYTDSIKDKGELSSLNYQFKSFANIGLLNLIFIEPLNTESFELDPEPEQHQKNSYNMNMFLFQSQGMEPNEEKNIVLEYRRAETRTTAEIMEAMTGDAQKAGTVKKNEEKMPLWIVITVIGGISIAAASMLIFIMKRKPSKPKHESNDIKKAKLRSMLMEGSINQEEYDELLKKLGGRSNVKK